MSRVLGFADGFLWTRGDGPGTPIEANIALVAGKAATILSSCAQTRSGIVLVQQWLTQYLPDAEMNTHWTIPIFDEFYGPDSGGSLLDETVEQCEALEAKVAALEAKIAWFEDDIDTLRT